MRCGKGRGYVYLDNAASSFPKPRSVAEAVGEWIRANGANPGRSGHGPSLAASELLYDTRRLAGEMFGASPENIIFCSNATHALNTAIFGMAVGGKRIIISDMEHNSVSRPVYMLKKWGACRVDVFDSGDDDTTAVEGFEACLREDTCLAVVTRASNVTGRVLPIEEIYKICKRRGIPLIVDGAQSSGHIDSGGGDIICMPGHKGLYGPQGTGILAVKGDLSRLRPLTYGGTGTSSAELYPDPLMPESYEAGTANCPGIAGLKAGLEFVRSRPEGIEDKLAQTLCEELKDIKGVTLYRGRGRYLPVVSFSIEGISSEEAAAMLWDKYRIAVRGGLHCAPLCHKKLGTLECGLVRASIGAFNSVEDVERLVGAVRGMLRLRRK